MVILSLTQGDTDNLGDQAIQKVIHFYYSQKGDEVVQGQFYPEVGKDIAYKKKMYGNKLLVSVKNESIIKKNVKRIPGVYFWYSKFKTFLERQNIKKRLKVYYISEIKKRKYDLILIGGGQLIKHNHDFIYCMDFWCKHFSEPKILLGIGCDTDLSRKEVQIYKQALVHCDTVIVRDTMAEKVMRQMEIECVLAPDVVFLFSKLFPRFLEEKEEAYFLIEIYAYNSTLAKDREAYYMYLEEQIMDNSNRTEQKIAVAYSTYDDYLEGGCFVKFLQEKRKYTNVILLNTDSLEMLVMAIIKAKIVFSGRMHVLILAMSYGKRISIFEVSDKLKNFKEMYYRNRNIAEVQRSIENHLEEIAKCM